MSGFRLDKYVVTVGRFRFLPSEAEWEYAAAGGSEQREYPWGSTDPGTANQYAIYDCYYPSGMSSCALGMTNIAPVGAASLGAGRWGQLDVVGELLQWNLDWEAPYVEPCVDGADLSVSCCLDSFRVFHSGNFLSDASYLFPAIRHGGDPTFGYEDTGIRCARTP